ncbi:MAG: hypothetical protein COX30_02700 [Candidatus Moranbacteria bacterium CG23_combo_of_CG06-09_8_20_14_all_39_10]|nr:MAG: hypothetical protein COX30_02700 [Candidatus Moranbacteria bacterium CG23_combo_of_CG06-09_8_20_14_all_39_10]
MLDKKLKEAIELLGGKAVVKDGEQLFIVMTLREFKKVSQEATSGLTKQELIDKINKDIASWKFAQEEKQGNSIDLDEIGEIEDNEVTYEKA